MFLFIWISDLLKIVSKLRLNNFNICDKREYIPRFITNQERIAYNSKHRVLASV